mgnify:FL=1
MKDDKTSGTVNASYTLIDTTPDEGIQIFRKVTSAEELQTGNRYLIVCEDKSTAWEPSKRTSEVLAALLSKPTRYTQR